MPSVERVRKHPGAASMTPRRSSVRSHRRMSVRLATSASCASRSPAASLRKDRRTNAEVRPDRSMRLTSALVPALMRDCRAMYRSTLQERPSSTLAASLLTQEP